MKRKIDVELSDKGIKELQKGLKDYDKWLKAKTDELAKRLADMGAVKASLEFSRAIYTGPEDHEISITKKENGYIVLATGETVLFVEFGSGLIGYGYPPEELNGMGPGTYPGKGHWNDPKGWYLPKDKQAKDGTKHTYGNPPNMPMYNTVKELEQELERVVREVFR